MKTLLLDESEGMLQRIVDEFDRVCKRRKLKVNAGRSKVMVFERVREQTINFANPYRVAGLSTAPVLSWPILVNYVLL